MFQSIKKFAADEVGRHGDRVCADRLADRRVHHHRGHDGRHQGQHGLQRNRHHPQVKVVALRSSRWVRLAGAKLRSGLSGSRTNETQTDFPCLMRPNEPRWPRTLIHLSIFAFFPALMALSASMDLLTFTIPNRICVALALGYVIFAALLGVPAVEILLNMSCGLVIFLITFAMFNFGLIGGGDAKLAAATAAWLGWAAILDYGLAAAIFGGILTLILLGLRTGAFARHAGPPRLACAAAQRQRRRPLRDRIGGSRPRAIPELIHLGRGRLDRHRSRRRLSTDRQAEVASRRPGRDGCERANDDWRLLSVMSR